MTSARGMGPDSQSSLCHCAVNLVAGHSHGDSSPGDIQHLSSDPAGGAKGLDLLRGFASLVL